MNRAATPLSESMRFMTRPFDSWYSPTLARATPMPPDSAALSLRHRPRRPSLKRRRHRQRPLNARLNLAPVFDADPKNSPFFVAHAAIGTLKVPRVDLVIV